MKRLLGGQLQKAEKEGRRGNLRMCSVFLEESGPLGDGELKERERAEAGSLADTPTGSGFVTQLKIVSIYFMVRVLPGIDCITH